MIGLLKIGLHKLGWVTGISTMGKTELMVLGPVFLLVAVICLLMPVSKDRPSVAQELAGVRAELAAIRQLLEERQP